MTRLALAVLILACALALAIMPAFAESPQISRCAGQADMLAVLATKYGEQIVTRGQAQDGNMIVLTGNPSNGSWTLLEVSPDSMACIVGAGGRLEVRPWGVTG